MKLQEIDLEEFKKKGIEYNIQHPETKHKELISSLRNIGTSVWPKMTASIPWGNWTKADAIQYFARIVDSLRSVFYPIIPPKKKTEGYNDPYWELYREAEQYMKTEPPSLNDIAEWDTNRAKMISESDKKQYEEELTENLKNKIIAKIKEVNVNPDDPNKSKPIDKPRYPRIIDYEGKQYILRETRGGGLVLNKYEKII